MVYRACLQIQDFFYSLSALQFLFSQQPDEGDRTQFDSCCLKYASRNALRGWAPLKPFHVRHHRRILNNLATNYALLPSRTIPKEFSCFLLDKFTHWKHIRGSHIRTTYLTASFIARTAEHILIELSKENYLEDRPKHFGKFNFCSYQSAHTKRRPTSVF